MQDQATRHNHTAGQDHEVEPGGDATSPADQETLLSTELLEAQICSMAARLASSTCRWLQLVAEFDRRKGWVQWGMKSCAHWLAWSCSVSSQAARDYLRVARALTSMPLITAAFTSGRLSYSKVKVLTKVVGLVAEQTLLDQALLHTAAQLERVVRAFRRTDPAGDQQARRSARWWWDEDGMFVLHARLPADEGALLLAALQMAEQSVDLPAGPDPADGDSAEGDSAAAESADAAGSPPEPVDLAEALVAMANTTLAAGPSDSSGDDRHLVILHVDADLSRDAADPTGRCHLQDGPGLDRPTAERLICDAAVVAVVRSSLGPDGAGESLQLGRRTRKIPPALRRALRLRDGGCQFPGCPRRRYLEAHHVVHWMDGGPTDLDNLMLTCRFHHMQIHQNHFTLTPVSAAAGAGHWAFRRPDGTDVPADGLLFPPPPASADDNDTWSDGNGVDQPPAGRQGDGFGLAESVGVLCRAVNDPPEPPYRTAHPTDEELPTRPAHTTNPTDPTHTTADITRPASLPPRSRR